MAKGMVVKEGYALCRHIRRARSISPLALALRMRHNGLD